MKIKKIPKSFRRALWSYDIEEMRPDEDKKEIITQVLNHGTWEDLKLLFRMYPENDIKKAIKHPQRGVWFEKVLNFWTTMFNIRLKKNVWEKAIFNINPGRNGVNSIFL